MIRNEHVVTNHGEGSGFDCFCRLGDPVLEHSLGVRQMSEESNDSLDAAAGFAEPLDQDEEAAVLSKISSRNRKRILIPFALLIIVCIALSFVKDPVKPSADQTPVAPAKTTAP